MTKQPSYRFTGLEDDWKEVKLGEVFDIVTDYVANGSFESLRNNVKTYEKDNFAYMIRLQDASNSWKGPWLYTDEKGYNFLSKSRLFKDDILMSNVGTVGRFFQVPELDRPMTLAPNSVLIRSTSSNNQFLYFMMLTANIQDQIAMRKTPGVQDKINKTDFKKVIATLPSLLEQTAIGSFFQDIDQLISLQQRKLEVLKEQKKTYLKLLFPAKGQTKPALRFAGFEDDWKEVKLGEVASHRSGTSIEKYFAENGVYKVISIGSYGLDGEYIDQGIRAISNEVTDKKIVKENELTMVLNDKTSNGTIIGRTLLIKSSNEFVVNQRTEIISPKEILDSQYAYVLLNGNFREQVKKIVQGGTQIYVNYSSVEQLKLPLPSFPEQQAIGSFFQDLDKAVAKQEEKVNQLKESKQTLLRKMFI